MKLLDGLLVRHRQHAELGGVSHAGELLECLLRIVRQAVQLSDYELYDIVRVGCGVNAIQVPYPATFAVVKTEQTFLCQGGNELNGEEGIARRLLMNKGSEGRGAIRFAAQRIYQQLVQIIARKRCQYDVLHGRPCLSDGIELAHQGMGDTDFVVSVRPDEQQVLQINTGQQVLKEV